MDNNTVSELLNDYMDIPSQVNFVDWDKVALIRIRLEIAITEAKKDNWENCSKANLVALCSMNQHLRAYPLHALFESIK